MSTGENTLAPASLRDLPVSDLDRLVAALHLRYLGDRIESSASCPACEKSFDLAFSLRALVNSAANPDRLAEQGVGGPDVQGAFSLNNGTRFRLPALRDLEASAGMTAEEAARHLRQQCVLEGDPERDAETLDQAMAAAGPILDTDLEAACPECSESQTLRFEMLRFFGRAMAIERRFLNHEVHHLARAYGWARSEILAMTRDDRRAHVRMVLAERVGPRR